MVVLTAKVSKAKLVAILLVIAIIVALLVVLSSRAGQDGTTAENVVTTVASNEDRVAYLQSFGWEVADSPLESQEVRIPAELPEVLQRYNELQQSQGFDLEQFAGKTVRRYVYEVLNYPDDDQVIGGDVTAASQDGLMQGLQYPKTTT